VLGIPTELEPHALRAAARLDVRRSTPTNCSLAGFAQPDALAEQWVSRKLRMKADYGRRGFARLRFWLSCADSWRTRPVRDLMSGGVAPSTGGR